MKNTRRRKLESWDQRQIAVKRELVCLEGVIGKISAGFIINELMQQHDLVTPIQLCGRFNLATYPLPFGTYFPDFTQPQPSLTVAWTQHSHNRKSWRLSIKRKSCTYKPELADYQWQAYSSVVPQRTCCSPAAANHWNREKRSDSGGL